MTQTVTSSYTLSSGSGNTGTATFVVMGPTNAGVNALTGAVDISLNPWPQQAGPYMSFGTQTTTNGIKFTASSTPPQGNTGAYTWIQLINSDKVKYLTSGHGIQNCTTSAFAPNANTAVTDSSPALDTVYPYATGNSTNDNPGLQLIATSGGDLIGEMAVAVSSTMYSMWTPSAATGCSGFGCTIPIALGTVNWNYSCDAINALTQQSNSTNWAKAGAVPHIPGFASFSPGTSHPSWTRSTDGEAGPCQ